MHNIKLVAIDLDDTLLRDDLTISQFSLDILREVHQAGVTVALSTGRMLPSALPYAQELGFDAPLITYQGALAKSSLDGEVIYSCPLSREVASMAIQYARRKKIHVNLYLEDKLYVERIAEAGERYARFTKVPCIKVDSLEELLEATLPYKLLLIDEEQRIEQRLQELQALLNGAKLDAYLTKSKPTFLEVNHRLATKGEALKRLAEWLGVTRKEVAAFGDSYNDLEMLEYAGGNSFAVANAYPTVRAMAKRTILSNNEDGVAQALRELILDKVKL